jgi:uncharacterized protein (TIGR03437 family)
MGRLLRLTLLLQVLGGNLMIGSGEDPSAAVTPALDYFTYLGGREPEWADAVAVDPSGNIYVTGETDSTDFPTANAHKASCSLGSQNSCADAFVAKFSSSGGLVYSTYLGGSRNDEGTDIAVDRDGNAYVTGYQSDNEGFVAKLDPAGRLVYLTTIPGKPMVMANAIAVDAAGYAYVAGAVLGELGRLVDPLQSSPGGASCTPAGGSPRPQSAFVAKLNPQGVIVYLTYLGGDDNDSAYGIAVDSQGNIYVVGETSSRDFPLVKPIQPSYSGGDPQGPGQCGGGDIFITKLNPSGSQILFSTYLGGVHDEEEPSVAVDSMGNLLVVGSTESSDFPTMQPLRAASAGRSDGFVAKIVPTGPALAFSSYLGGGANDSVLAVTTDALGDIYLAGFTQSPDFPVESALRPTISCSPYCMDSFLTKLASDGTKLVYSSFLGADGVGLALDPQGRVVVVGSTGTSGLATPNAYQRSLAGFADVFMARFDGVGPAAPAIACVSAASFVPAAPVAPGSIAAGFGQGLAAGTLSAATVPLPTTLADTSVRVQDSQETERMAPLFFVSPAQINYLVPEGTATGRAVVNVVSRDQTVAMGALSVVSVSPGLFTANNDGRGAPAAIAVRYAADNSQSWDYAFQCAAAVGSCVPKPIDLGTETDRVYLQLYGTGIRGRSSLTGVSAKLGGTDAEIQYAGPQGTLVGLDQVNMLLPRSLRGRGEVEVTLSIDGTAANPVRVNIQ